MNIGVQSTKKNEQVFLTYFSNLLHFHLGLRTTVSIDKLLNKTINDIYSRSIVFLKIQFNEKRKSCTQCIQTIKSSCYMKKYGSKVVFSPDLFLSMIMNLNLILRSGKQCFKCKDSNNFFFISIYNFFWFDYKFEAKIFSIMIRI